MITKKDETVEITIEAANIEKSIALLMDMRDFCKEQNDVEEGKSETIEALDVAIETMQAFWCEHFGEEEAE